MHADAEAGHSEEEGHHVPSHEHSKQSGHLHHSSSAELLAAAGALQSPTDGQI